MIIYSKANVFTIDSVTISHTKSLVHQTSPLATSTEVTTQAGMDNHNYVILKNFNTEELTVGRNYQLMLFTERGVQLIQVALTFLADNVQANFRILETQPIVDRRNNVKVPVHIQGTLLTYLGPGPLAPLDPPVKIAIKNLSVGGMLMASNTPLELEGVYFLRFTVDRLDVDISLKLIRQDETDSPDTYLYGCQFGRMSESVESHLCNYIYRVQIEEHQKNKRLANGSRLSSFRRRL